MYSDVFCKVYNEFGWNYYPEAFGEALLQWLKEKGIAPKCSMDLACGTGVLCRILKEKGIEASGMDFSAGMIEIARSEDPEGKYEVADMVTYRPETRYDLVTCTGDAINHIAALPDVLQVFRNVYAYLMPGGYFVFDILNEKEVSSGEPFEMDYSETVRVWFQMTKPGDQQVNLKIRVYENNMLSFEENIRETVHAPEEICRMLEMCGFRVLRCGDSLLENGTHGTTWFVIAQKPGIAER